MNRRPSGLKLDKAVTGFMQYKTAEGLSPRTLVGYEHDLKLWVKYADDVDVSAVTSQDIRAYLAWLRTEYKPRRFSGGEQPLSPKTVRNSWVTLSAFFAWAAIEFNGPDPMQGVAPPQYKEPPVEPFTKEQVEALLKVAEYCREANTTERRRFTMRRATGRRNRAIILTLLDTGLRASELCALKISDVDQKTGKVEVKHGVCGGAKGGKGRTVYLGQGTRRALWRYLAEREDGEDPNAPLFVGKFNRPLNSNSLRHVIVELGKKAQVGKCHPHKFRHTFAITYLRSGGDVFTLQALLGHVCTQKLSDGKRERSTLSTHGVPLAAEPSRPGFRSLNRAVHIPLRARFFETLGHNLFAAAFDGTTAKQVTCGAELVILHAGGIVGKIGNGLAGFFTMGGEVFTRLNDRRDTARPQVRSDPLQPRCAVGEGGEGRLGDPLQPVRRMIPVHDLHGVGIVQLDQVPNPDGAITHKH